MIDVIKSPNADSRSGDEMMSEDTLKKSTESHIKDVTNGLNFIADLLKERGPQHDHTKMEHMTDFYNALTGGSIKETPWYKLHTTSERHHLKTHVPEDVNLIDVLEHVVDCTMAGTARSGTVYDIDLMPEILTLAVNNTVELLKKNINLVDEEKDLMDDSTE